MPLPKFFHKRSSQKEKKGSKNAGVTPQELETKSSAASNVVDEETISAKPEPVQDLNGGKAEGILQNVESKATESDNANSIENSESIEPEKISEKNDSESKSSSVDIINESKENSSELLGDVNSIVEAKHEENEVESAAEMKVQIQVKDSMNDDDGGIECDSFIDEIEADVKEERKCSELNSEKLLHIHEKDLESVIGNYVNKLIRESLITALNSAEVEHFYDEVVRNFSDRKKSESESSDNNSFSSYDCQLRRDSELVEMDENQSSDENNSVEKETGYDEMSSETSMDVRVESVDAELICDTVEMHEEKLPCQTESFESSDGQQISNENINTIQESTNHSNILIVKPKDEIFSDALSSNPSPMAIEITIVEKVEKIEETEEIVKVNLESSDIESQEHKSDETTVTTQPQDTVKGSSDSTFESQTLKSENTIMIQPPEIEESKSASDEQSQKHESENTSLAQPEKQEIVEGNSDSAFESETLKSDNMTATQLLETEESKSALDYQSREQESEKTSSIQSEQQEIVESNSESDIESKSDYQTITAQLSDEETSTKQFEQQEIEVKSDSVFKADSTKHEEETNKAQPASFPSEITQQQQNLQANDEDIHKTKNSRDSSNVSEVSRLDVQSNNQIPDLMKLSFDEEALAQAMKGSPQGEPISPESKDLGEDLPQHQCNEDEKKVNWKVGYLHVKLPHKTRGKGNLKVWKKRCVAMQPDEFVNDPKNPSLMVSVYSAESGTSRKHGALLWKTVSSRSAVVYRSKSSSHRYAFTIAEDDRPVLHLAAECETDSQEWMSAIRAVLWPPNPVIQLERVLSGSEFEVSFVDNDFSFRAGLLGSYGFFHVTQRKLILVNPHLGHVVQEWYLNTVDKFRLVPQPRAEDAHKVVAMTTCSDSSTGSGELLIYCSEAVSMLQSVASTIHKVLTYRCKEEGGSYKKELDELAGWLVTEPKQEKTQTSGEEYYKVPPRQVKSLLDIPNFIFDKPVAITVSSDVSSSSTQLTEQSLTSSKTCISNFSHDSGISEGLSSDDLLCSLTSFTISSENSQEKSSDSDLSDSYTPPLTPEMKRREAKEISSVTLKE